MTANERFRAEWAMYLIRSTEELVCCYQYEVTRFTLQHPDFRYLNVPHPKTGQPIATTAGECQEMVAHEFGLNLMRRYFNGFELPYLMLSAEQKEERTEVFPDYEEVSWVNLIKDRLKPIPEILKEAEQLLLKFRTDPPLRGRAAILAQIRTDLKAIGAFRILERYKWNRLPIEPDIELYSSQQAWLRAKNRATKLPMQWPDPILATARIPRT